MSFFDAIRNTHYGNLTITAVVFIILAFSTFIGLLWYQSKRRKSK